MASAAAVAWQFSGRDPEARERTALRIIAVSFFALAAYVTVDSVRALLGAGEPSTPRSASSWPPCQPAWSCRCCPGRSAGPAASSARRSAVADSKQTLLCTYLSAVLLVGLVLNALLGWWWADPLAALVIAAVAVKEGREAWRGDACCDAC